MPAKKKKKTEDFDLVGLPTEALDNDITAADFVPVKIENASHEQKFQTKPTTFLKDSIKRFGKNKSSVVAAVILGILLVVAFIVPAVESDIAKPMQPYATYLEPKLFNTGTGWWDGTKKYDDIPVAKIEDETGKTRYVPDPSTFRENAIVGDVVVYSGTRYRNTPNKYATGGSLKFTVNEFSSTVEPYVRTNKFLRFSSFDPLVYDKDGYVYYDIINDDIAINATISNTDYPTEDYPSNIYHDFNVVFFYDKFIEEGKYQEEMVYLKQDVDKDITELNIPSVSTILKSIDGLGKDEKYVLRNPRFGFSINNIENHEYILLIKSLTFDTTNVHDENLKYALNNSSFIDGNTCLLRENEVYYPIELGLNPKTTKALNPARWSSTSEINLYRAEFQACSFTYDTYEAKIGLRENYTIGSIDLNRYLKNKWIYFDNDVSQTTKTIEITIRNKEYCPLTKGGEYKIKNYSKDTETYEIEADILLYKYYGYTEMPKYIFGTDVNGHNMNKYTFEGLRNSLLLGIITSAICFIFGLIWGSICGYFGGATDLVMERFTDILSGVPWIVVMTLCIIKLGQSMLVFGLALCLTGWIGTAATTRTQFYRFKNREYVLASRTLGASDPRLIFKHVLPNAMGTIITSAVLMIPSVIFSEATISYLGLGLKGLSSLGVILSDNQKEILTNPYLLLFPSVIIALIMISFNLFGNGLRDAINPSLKGEEE